MNEKTPSSRTSRTIALDSRGFRLEGSKAAAFPDATSFLRFLMAKTGPISS